MDQGKKLMYLPKQKLCLGDIVLFCMLSHFACHMACCSEQLPRGSHPPQGLQYRTVVWGAPGSTGDAVISLRN